MFVRSIDASRMTSVLLRKGKSMNALTGRRSDIPISEAAPQEMSFTSVTTYNF